MLTNIPLLFILLLIIAFSLCENDKDACNETHATSRNDCFARSVPNRYCCFVSLNNPCQSISREELDSKLNYDCGITEERYGKYEFGQYHPDQPKKLKDLGFETCGKSEPKKKGDCTDYSEISNSCCLFSIGEIKACLHIGRKFIGKSKKTTFKIEDNGDEINVECKSYNIIFNLYSILLIALLFL